MPFAFYMMYLVFPAMIVAAVILRRRCAWLPPVRWLTVLALGYLGSFCIEIGNHRLFSHGAFEASNVVTMALIVGSSFFFHGDVRTWAFMHRNHHKFCEDALDYHSPIFPYKAASDGWLDQPDHGLWYAHTTWMTVNTTRMSRWQGGLAYKNTLPDLIDNETVGWWQDAIGDGGFGMIAHLLIAILLAVHASQHDGAQHDGAQHDGAQHDGPLTEEESRVRLLRATAPAHLTCFTRARRLCIRFVFYLGFYSAIPILWCWHSVMLINSVTHVWGVAPYADAMTDACQSRNIAWLWLVHLGGNWHNTHHAAPTSATTWARWYHVDAQFVVIRALEGVGLVSGVKTEEPIAKPNADWETTWELTLMTLNLVVLGALLVRARRQ